MPSMTEVPNNGVDQRSNGVHQPSNDVQQPSNGVKQPSNGVEPNRKIYAMEEQSSTELPSVADSTYNLSVWNSLSRLLPPRNPDCDYWWEQTGPQLAIMLYEAGYSIQEQYEGMLFHYHFVVPRLGPCLASNGTLRYRSPLLGIQHGIPVAYSWKWNAAGVGATPDVRYTIDAIGPSTGTISDPLNQAATKEFFHQLKALVPSMDLSWFHEFDKVLYDDNKETYTPTSASYPTSTMFVAFELLKKGLELKAYFLPSPKNGGHSGGSSDLELWEKAVRGVTTDSTNLDELMHFLRTDAEGSLLQPWLLAIDCGKPADSRIKLYFRTPHTSFDSVRTIMTMGGKIRGSHVDQALGQLDELIKLSLDLDKDFPSSAEVPERGTRFPGYAYYFDVASRATMPDVKFYLPIRGYAKNDLQAAEGLTRWMQAHGRGQFAESYMRILDGFATNRPLDARTGIQTYQACMIQNASLSITSYMSHDPNIPHKSQT